MKTKEKIDKIKSQLDKIETELSVLEEDEAVKRYIQLKSYEETLQNEKKNLEKDALDERYYSCSHVFVKPLGTTSIHDERCLKCGLSPRLKGTKASIYTNIECDYDLARKIFEKILADNPEMSDATASFILKSTLKEVNARMETENKKNSR